MSAVLRVEGACMYIALQKSEIIGTGDPKNPEASNTAELFLEDRGPLMILDDVVAPTVTWNGEFLLGNLYELGEWYQWSLNYPFGGQQKCKSMVNLRGFPLTVHCLGW